MRQTYLLWLAAIAMFGISFHASAQSPCEVKWNIEGALQLYANLSSELPSDALEGETSYSVPVSGRPYFRPADGYYIQKIESTKTVIPSIDRTNDGRQYFNFFNGNANYYGQTITVTLLKLSDIVEDKSFTLNIVNGADFLDNVRFTSTQKTINAKNGKQTITYSETLDNSIQICEKSLNPIFKVEKNGTPVTKKNTWDTYYTVNLADGDEVSVTVFENGEPAKHSGKVIFEENGAEAVTMLSNATRLSRIENLADFSYYDGDKLKLTVNTEDYNVSLKHGDQNIEVDHTGKTFTYATDALTDDVIFTVSATDREYDNVEVQIVVINPEGIVVREGSPTGDIIDLSAITPEKGGLPVKNGVTKNPFPEYSEDSYSLYKISISAKNPKIFVSNAEGWYITSYSWNSNAMDREAFNESMSTTPENGALYILAKKITREKTLHVYADGELSNARLFTANHERITLTEGYNEFKFDPDYDMPMSISPITYGSGESPLKCILNGTALVADEDNNGLIAVNSTDDAILKIHADGMPSYKQAFTADKWAKAEISYDKILRHEGQPSIFTAHKGMEISVKPAAGTLLTDLDGNEITLDNGRHTFVMGESAAYKLSGTAPEYSFTPEEGGTAYSLDKILISFPGATDVTRNAAMANDEVMFASLDMMYAAWDIVIEKVEDAEAPTFSFSFNPQPTKIGTYNLSIPEGFFIIDGTECDDISATFKLAENTSSDDLEYTLSPSSLSTSDYPGVAVIFDEKYTVRINDKTKIMVEWDGNKLPADDYQLMPEANILLINLSESYMSKPGTLSINLKAGALDVSGIASPAIENTWVIAAPKTYTYTITPDADTYISKIGEITICFDNADSAEVNPDFYVMPTLKNTNIGYFQNGTITKVEGSEKPTFRITFATEATTEGTYSFECRSGRFLLDGEKWSPAIECEYSVRNNESSAVNEINGSDFVNATVITLDGRIISRNADKNLIDSLEKGVYIINGKKYLKK